MTASAIVASYKLSQAADEDLDRLFDHGIDRFGLDQAIEYWDGLNRRFSELAETPQQWQAVEYIRSGYRRSVYGSHSIYYRIEADEIVVVRILGQENPDTAF